MHTKENWFFFSASWCRHWPRNQWNTVAELQKSQKKHVVVCDKFYLYFLSGEIACRETGYRRTLAPNSLVFIESTWYPPPTLVDPPFVFFFVFTSRCYASAVLAVGLCPSVSVSVRLSQVGVLSKRLNESSWFLACEFPSNRPTLC